MGSGYRNLHGIGLYRSGNYFFSRDRGTVPSPVKSRWKTREDCPAILPGYFTVIYQSTTPCLFNRNSYGPVLCGFKKAEILRCSSVRFSDVCKYYGALRCCDRPCGAVRCGLKKIYPTRCGSVLSCIVRCGSVRFSEIRNPTVRAGAVLR